VRSWADEAGLLLPADPEDPPRPKVPQAVCDSCPICQAAATLDQVNPQVLVDITEVARSVITGLGSALASAADQRTFDGGTTDRAESLDEWDEEGPGSDPGTTDPDLGD
jgi:hypothetical protein